MRGHLLGFLFQLLLLGSAIAQPVVSNLTVGQQAHDPHHVVISYDVSGANGPMAVSLEVSNDNGTTFSIKPQLQYLSGAIGPGIQNGTGHTIIWNAMADIPNIHWPETRVKVVAVEETDKGDDAEPPVTLTISTDPTSFRRYSYPRETSAIIAYFKFSSPVTGFDTSDISVWGAEKESAGGSGADYGIWITGTGGWVTISVPGNVTTPPTLGNSYSFYFPERWFVELPNGEEIEMIGIPSGTFQMGSPESELSRGADETLRNVTLSDVFYISSSEITAGQWNSIQQFPKNHVPQDPRAPINNVSWSESQEWTTVLSQRTPYSVQFQLPTEAQWERACRGGTNTRFNFGDSTTAPDDCTFDSERNSRAWYCANSKANSGPIQSREGSENLWLLKEMHGNVAEWVADWYGPYETDALVDPKGPANGPGRVIRGGGWLSDFGECRAAQRDHAPPDTRHPDVGFRIVATRPNTLTITSSNREITNKHLKQKLTFTFKHPVSGFDISDIILTNATSGPLYASNANTYTLDINTKTGGDLSVHVPKNAGLPNNDTATYTDFFNHTWTIMLPGEVPMELVRIPRGSFRIGSNQYIYTNLSYDYSPPHYLPTTGYGNTFNANISNDYYIGKTELTHRQWQAIHGVSASGPTDPQLDYPKTNLTWDSLFNENDGFFTKFNDHLSSTRFLGATTTLPTEAQWEKACMAGVYRYFSFHWVARWSDPVVQMVPAPWPMLFRYKYLYHVVGGTSDSEDPASFIWHNNSSPTKVGDLRSNTYGLYDMLGNVAELCLDKFAPYPVSSYYDTNIQVDPINTAGTEQIIRGGSFRSTLFECGSSVRGKAADINANTIGMRVVLQYPLTLNVTSNIPDAIHESATQTLTFVFSDDVSGFTAEMITMTGARRGILREITPRKYELDVTCTGGLFTATVEQNAIRPPLPYTHVTGATFSNFFRDTWTVELPGGIPMELVRVPPGSFTMGSPATEVSRAENELEHSVKITNDFYLAKTPVTMDQWQAIQGNSGKKSDSLGNTTPATGLSWHDIMDSSTGFMARLNLHIATSNQGPARATLPTEAQWEYASRAGTTTRFHFGDGLGSDDRCSVSEELEENMWYCANSGAGPQPVGLKPANPWGLHDMHGNVWEWCLDWFGAYASHDETDPAGPELGTTRVLRGGSWADYAKDCRSAARGASDPTVRNDKYGFRVLINRMEKTPGAPDAPIASPATHHATDGFQANWEYVDSAVDYRLEIATDPDFLHLVEEYTGRLVGNKIAHSVTGLDPATFYYFRIQAVGDFKTGNYSNTIKTHTLPVGNQLLIITDAPKEFHSMKDQAITILFGQDVTDFDVSKVNVSGAIKGAFSGSGKSYTLQIMGIGGNISIEVPEDCVPEGNTAARLTNFYQDIWTVQLPGTTTLDMIRIPAGSFIMGSPLWEISREEDEKQREVIISEDFYMGVTEVTENQYNALLSQPLLFWDRAKYNIAWNAIAEPETGYIHYLNEYIIKSNNGPGIFMLPTEAQWEYACRAGTSTRFSFGDDVLPTLHLGDLCDITPLRQQYMEYCGSSYDYGPAMKRPNSWGLHDMHGNLGEWCSDWYGEYPEVAEVDPAGPATGTNRVVRGGSLNNRHASERRSANRAEHTPNYGHYYSGFRLVAKRPAIDPTLPPAPNAHEATHVSATEFHISWDPVPDATSYRLDIANDLYFESIVTTYEDFDLGNVLDFTVTGLVRGTQYFYRLRAVNESGVSINSNAVEVITTPMEPVALDPITVTSTGIDALWEETNGATNYRVDVAYDQDFTEMLASDLNAGSNLTLNIPAPAGLTYFLRVKAYNNWGASEYSNVIMTGTAPEKPVLATASNPTTSSFTVNWSPVPFATRYRLNVSANIYPSGVMLPGYEDLELNDAGTSFTLTGLDPGRAYYFWLESGNQWGWSLKSSRGNARTMMIAPIATKATNLTSSGFQLNWLPTSGDGGYYFDLSTDPDFLNKVPNYDNRWAGSSVLHQATGLVSGQTYYYRLRRSNSEQTTESSNVIKVVLNLTPPSAVFIDSITTSSARVQWAPAPNATNYRIDASPLFLNHNAGPSTSIALTDLSQFTTYYIYVYAENDSGISTRSEQVTLRTHLAPPVALEATHVTETGFQANWEHPLLVRYYYFDLSTTSNFATMVNGYSNLELSGVKNLTLKDLTPGATFYYRLRAWLHDELSHNSNIIQTSGSISAPTDFRASDFSTSGFTIHWNPVVGAEGYSIDVSLDPNFDSLIENNRDMGNVPNFIISDLTPMTTHFVRVRSYSTSATSSNSIVFPVTTNPLPGGLVIQSDCFQNLHQAPTQIITFQFGEPVSGFDQTDIKLAGATSLGIQGTGSYYTMEIANQGGRVSVTVGENAVVQGNPLTSFSNFYQDVWTINLPGNVPMELLRIPAGTFIMGSPQDELSRSSSETQHEVTISQEFYIGKTEVTQKQWLAIYGSFPSGGQIGGLAGNKPVHTITWNSIMDPAEGFMKRLNDHIGATSHGLRLVTLPTEAQWEYACRAGTTTRFSYGNGLSTDEKCTTSGGRISNMWYCGNSNNGLQLVGEKLPNPWNLYDLHGNLWEWCLDFYTDFTPDPVIDPSGPDSGEQRIVRGGSYWNDAFFCRSAQRAVMDSALSNYHVGFRVAAPAPQAP